MGCKWALKMNYFLQPIDLIEYIWSGREDLNLRPHAPHACTLPGCATPRRKTKL
jgi:hypothetical protein